MQVLHTHISSPSNNPDKCMVNVNYFFLNFNYISGSNNGSFSSHLDCVGVSSAQSVLSVASSVRHDSNRSRSRLLMHADSQSSDFSSGNESTAALLQKRSLSRDELSSRQATNSSRSLSRCRNPSVNWSSTEGKITLQYPNRSFSFEYKT